MQRPRLFRLLPPIVLATAALLLLPGCVALAGVLSASADGPAPAVEASLRRTLRALKDPSLRRPVEEAWREARQQEARARTAPWWNGTFRDEADRRWESALAGARLAQVAQEDRRRQTAELWRASREQAEASRRRLASLDSDLLDPAFVAARSSSDAAWARALRRAGAGDLDGAAAAARDSAEAAQAALAAWQVPHARFLRPTLRRQWSEWAEAAVEDSRREGAAILVDKLSRRLHLWRRGRLVATFPAELGRRGLERKLRSGDRATPEGRYRVEVVKEGPHTRYYKALLLDYPNGEDRRRLQRAIADGQAPRGSVPGGLIEIHGHGGRNQDWTDGCVALRDEDMDALWAVARKGLSVTIVGTLP